MSYLVVFQGGLVLGFALATLLAAAGRRMHPQVDLT